jgi:outer membrane lipoprotein-sorting protein
MFLQVALMALGIANGDAIAADQFDDAKALELVKLVDERQRNSGDYQSLCYVKENERNKEPKVFQAVVYRRDKDDKFMILFTKPKEEAGKGYLKIDKNLWMYDPNTGKWERRTEREHIGGTNSRREDFDESRLADEFNVKADGTDKLGSYQVYKTKLDVKPGKDVAYPILRLWIDQADKNVLKREEYSLSNKLMRTTYYPKWIKRFSKSKNGDVWIPEELRIFDELEKGNSTIVLIKETSLDPVDASIFTKAWIESKSR